MGNRARRLQLLALVAFATLLGIGERVLLAWAYPIGGDLRNYLDVVRIVEHSGNVYAETRWYNYAPPWAYVLVGLKQLSGVMGQPFHVTVREFLTAVDVVNALLIGKIAVRWLGRPWQVGYATYLLNPVAIILTGVHAQFETLAAVPLLVATWQFGRITVGGMWLLGTVAIVLKQIVGFQAWMLFGYGRSVRASLLLAAAAIGAWAATFLPFLPAGADGILQHVLGYQSVPGLYGVGFLPRALGMPLFITAMFLSPQLAARMHLSPALAMRLSAVLFITLIYGIGEQYFLLPILFGAAAGGRWFWLYTAAVAVLLGGTQDSLQLTGVPVVWNSVWFVSLLWILALLRPLPVVAARPAIERLTRTTRRLAQRIAR